MKDRQIKAIDPHAARRVTIRQGKGRKGYQGQNIIGEDEEAVNVFAESFSGQKHPAQDKCITIFCRPMTTLRRALLVAVGDDVLKDPLCRAGHGRAPGFADPGMDLEAKRLKLRHRTDLRHGQSIRSLPGRQGEADQNRLARGTVPIQQRASISEPDDQAVFGETAPDIVEASRRRPDGCAVQQETNLFGRRAPGMLVLGHPGRKLLKVLGPRSPQQAAIEAQGELPLRIKSLGDVRVRMTAQQGETSA